jgi:hypothetical protein
MNNEPLPKIEKGFPIPEQHRQRREGTLSSVLRLMEAGDSMVVTPKQRNGVFAIAHNLKIKLLSRTMDDGTVRVWRIK